jgi:2-dehydropantoate 2-reductase
VPSLPKERHCRALGGVAQISASIVAPRVIQQVGTFMRMIFGEFDGKPSKRGEDFLALCLKAGFDATLNEQILTEPWMKFILLASNAGIMALARQPIGKLRDDPDLRPILNAAYQEAIDVGRARGVALPADALERILELTRHLPPGMKASMALDLDRGNRLELPLARRQGRRTRPPARYPDADAQHDVCDAEALQYGCACVSSHAVIASKARTFGR